MFFSYFQVIYIYIYIVYHCYLKTKDNNDNDIKMNEDARNNEDEKHIEITIGEPIAEKVIDSCVGTVCFHC